MELPRDPDLDELPDAIPTDEPLKITTMTEDGVQTAYMDAEMLAHAIADGRRARERRGEQ